MYKKILTIFLAFILIFSCTGCTEEETQSTIKALENLFKIYETLSGHTENNHYTANGEEITFTAKDGTEITVPAYADDPWVEINNDEPFFTKKEITKKAYEKYSDLDDLKRCGPAIACLGPETLPTEKRGNIGSVKPSGWHSVKYPKRIKDNYLYNRCHLIAYELSAENANKKNLITGTRYLNIQGMLDFENTTRAYIDQTYNHVMYRVTPVFIKDELVCRGVLMEIKSVEDQGKGLSHCIYCYNVQPGINIDYRTGESSLAAKN